MKDMTVSQEFLLAHPNYRYLPQNALWSLEQAEKSSVPETGRLSPGFHTKIVRGNAYEVEQEVNEFYNEMQKLYPTFNVTQTTTDQNLVGIAVTITYKV